MTADQIRSLQPALAALLVHFRPFFKREATFKHWECYLLGLMADLKRKSIEPIALAAGVAVRTLQEFLAFFVWGHKRVAAKLQQLVMDEHAAPQAIGVIDASAHAKQGRKTPGVQRQDRQLRGRPTSVVHRQSPQQSLQLPAGQRSVLAQELGLRSPALPTGQDT